MWGSRAELHEGAWRVAPAPGGARGAGANLPIVRPSRTRIAGLCPEQCPKRAPRLPAGSEASGGLRAWHKPRFIPSRHPDGVSDARHWRLGDSRGLWKVEVCSSQSNICRIRRPTQKRTGLTVSETSAWDESLPGSSPPWVPPFTKNVGAGTYRCEELRGSPVSGSARLTLRRRARSARSKPTFGWRMRSG